MSRVTRGRGGDDVPAHAWHIAEMADMGDMEMADESNAITVAPG